LRQWSVQKATKGVADMTSTMMGSGTTKISKQRSMK
jgi:hypothetical protein